MNKPIKLGFKRGTCSRKKCIHQSSYIYREKHYCFCHAKNTKWFKKHFSLPEETSNEMRTTTSVSDLDKAFFNALKTVRGY